MLVSVVVAALGAAEQLGGKYKQTTAEDQKGGKGEAGEFKARFEMREVFISLEFGGLE